jgi:two-component system, chemotaxis family, chemotaxis protein CheY
MAADPLMPILMVDDSGAMGRIIRNLLQQAGFQRVDSAADGPSALARMRDKRYGLVLSDWNMAPMSGIELLKQVRADQALAQTPFIIMSAESKTENAVAAKQAGVDSYLVKPFNAETLKSRIDAVCA